MNTVIHINNVRVMIVQCQYRKMAVYSKRRGDYSLELSVDLDEPDGSSMYRTIWTSLCLKLQLCQLPSGPYLVITLTRTSRRKLDVKGVSLP
jgi:hypothetical protein